MESPIKEKYNILKGVVGLFDTKLSAAVIVSLIITVFLLSNKVGSQQDEIGVLQDQKTALQSEMYERLISQMKGEVKDEVKKKTDTLQKVAQEQNSKVDTILEKANNTLNKLNENIPNKLR